MNFRVINLALAILLFVCAYLTFDFHNWTQLTISIVLCLSGLHSLFTDSQSLRRRRFARSCLRLGAVISVFLIVKLLIWG